MSYKLKKGLVRYANVSTLCLLFSFVYEQFSHQVYSGYMVGLFAIPLVLGVVPRVIMIVKPALDRGGPWAKTVHAFAVATLITGSLLQGIVEIYGTTSGAIKYYFIAGCVLLLVSLILWIFDARALWFNLGPGAP